MIRVLYLIIVYNIFNNFQINNAREVTENDYDHGRLRLADLCGILKRIFSVRLKCRDNWEIESSIKFPF